MSVAGHSNSSWHVELAVFIALFAELGDNVAAEVDNLYTTIIAIAHVDKPINWRYSTGHRHVKLMFTCSFGPILADKLAGHREKSSHHA